MRRKLWIYLALLVVIPGLLFTVSCAKKVTQAEPSAEEEVVEAEPEVDNAARIAEERAAQEVMGRLLEKQRLKIADLDFIVATWFCIN